MAHYRLYLFIAVQIEEPYLVVLCTNNGHILIIIYQEFIGLLEDQGFIVIKLEVEDLLFLGRAGVEDGEKRLGVGDRKLVLLGEEPGATGGHDRVALHAAAFEPAEEGVGEVYLLLVGGDEGGDGPQGNRGVGTGGDEDVLGGVKPDVPDWLVIVGCLP